MAPDGRMFQTSRKGELFELKQGLNATSMKERKSSLKRTVAAMTLGKDVSSLFTDVVKNTAGDLSMKKLVYLYIINYAPAKPDLAILIVNTFIKDAVDPNPLIRALAIRTMALIPLEKITDHLCEPLHAAMGDRDPYVRKTAAVCVAKLYETNAALTTEEGFIHELQELLGDGNPMVVANAVAALSEIAQVSRISNVLPLTSQTVPRFLSAMAECTEWGQVFILDAIASYTPTDSEEADLMADRILPRLQHANPAVVLSAVKNIVQLMPKLDADEKRIFLIKKMRAPLVTLLTAQPELQFVALRNIALLVCEYPTLLSGDVRVFFTSYADPLYVKTEKLNTLVKLTDPSNVDVVLTELMEYTGEVDVIFAQKAVNCITQIGLNMPAYASRCVSLLSDLLRRDVVHITEQIALALRDILRVYPDQYDEIVIQLCGAADSIDDPNSKASLVWIIGEHANRIPTAIQMLEAISESFIEETLSVQLQMLTACVKAYLLRGPEAQKLVDLVLSYATQESEHVDVRDRGFIYLRIISGGFDSAQQVVLSNKQGIDVQRSELPIEVHKELLRSLSSIAAVYHKPARYFEGARSKPLLGQPIGGLMAEEDLLGIDDDNEPTSNAAPPAIMDNAESGQRPMGDSLLDDILGGGVPAALPPPERVPSDGDLLSNLGVSGLSVSGEPKNINTTETGLKKELLSAERGRGLSIRGGLSQDVPGSFALDLELHNASPAAMTNLAIQFDKNAFGLILSGPMDIKLPILPSTATSTRVLLKSGGIADASKGPSLQIAIKYSPGGVVYFAEDVSAHITSVFDKKAGLLTKPVYSSTWQSVPDSAEVNANIRFGSKAAVSVDHISQTLREHGVFTVARRGSTKPPVMYLSSVLVGGGNMVILCELTLPVITENRIGRIASRSTIPPHWSVAALNSFHDTCAQLLSQ